MSHYVGLDVSMKTVSVCVLDDQGEICREIDLKTDPEVIHSFLAGANFDVQKIGLETGSLTHWLTKELRSMGYEVHPMESRKMAAILATVVNKTDKNDARGIAEALRAGHYLKCVHRSDENMELRTLLHARDTLVRQRVQAGNSIRGFLKIYGLRIKPGLDLLFPDRVREEIEPLSPNVKHTFESMLNCLATLTSEIERLDVKLKELLKSNPGAKLLTTIDGVGTITALAFIAEIDDPERFQNSRDVPAYIGLTPRQYSSGEVCKQGKISKQGPVHLRYLLIEAATVLLTRSRGWSPIKAWGMKLLSKRGKKKAIVAVARKLAVVMHAMLKNNKTFNREGKKAKLKKQKA